MITISKQHLHGVPGHEQVIRIHGRHCRGFVCIHSTRRGPAFGGIRFKQYSSERDALNDALRLSYAMSLKCAMADLPCGGAKSVLIKRPSTNKEEALREFSEVLRSLQGTYFAGPDVGIHPKDLELLAELAPNVACESDVGLGSIAHHTALGVWHASRACIERSACDDSSIAIQGMGAVGTALARIACRENFGLKISDIEAQRCTVAGEFNAEVVEPQEILLTSCSVLAPCAVGGVITSQIAQATRAQAICGSANNQLDDDATSLVLDKRGVIFVPDLISSAGGVIRGVEFYLLNKPSSTENIAKIYSTTRGVLNEAKQTGATPLEVAHGMASAKLIS